MPKGTFGSGKPSSLAPGTGSRKTGAETTARALFRSFWSIAPQRSLPSHAKRNPAFSHARITSCDGAAGPLSFRANAAEGRASNDTAASNVRPDAGMGNLRGRGDHETGANEEMVEVSATPTRPAPSLLD